ncbi:putative ATP-dependent helicase protein [Cladobotryum mycophilum]|uniref:ATP-dependent helicase protein n=1 Tax=Cladobotryum mycophilum TaxID=491253 RepID=A0ABR0SRX3_9HYPO
MINSVICYGSLFNAAAKLWHKVTLPTSKSDAPFIELPVKQDNDIYSVYLEDGESLAVLDARTASTLNTLGDIPAVTFTAVIKSSVFAKRHKPVKSSKVFDVTINLMGPRHVVGHVASQLSKVSAHLQHPQWLDDQIEYYNPQFLMFDDVGQHDMNTLIGASNNFSSENKMRISAEVDNILESLTNVVTEGLLDLPDGLVSELKPLTSEGCPTLHYTTGKQRIRALPTTANPFNPGEQKKRESFGGLIADMMGLGKTLTMLAAIRQSTLAAEDFGSFYSMHEVEDTQKIRTKATLVVVTSAQLLQSWNEEIRLHFIPGALTCTDFHGSNRIRDLEAFRCMDVVLTTYATLAADGASQSLLQKMHWYRVVLDEAHWIRNSSSRQFRAVTALTSRSRWCLTGTPIQNKLDDLASIAGFLQLLPVPTKMAFQRRILGPLRERGPNFTKPLRAYLEAYCLRRKSDTCLNLITPAQQDVWLTLSPDEQYLYGLISDETKREADYMVSNNIKLKYSLLFKAMLRMRIMCNLGTFSSLGAYDKSNDTPDSQIGCGRCSVLDDDTLLLLSSYESCPDCGRPLNSPASPSDLTTGQKRKAGDLDSDMVIDSRRLPPTPTTPSCNSILSGFSTKLSAVVHNITCSDAGSKKLNLTVANRVHIVEPQWDPSVEEQAIARALRMGQTKKVTIVQYMMKNTVEKSIRDRQKKKKRLANFTFDSDSTSETSGRVEDIKEVLNLTL